MMFWMRQFKIRLRMQGAIAMVLTLFALVGVTGLLGGRQLASLNETFMTESVQGLQAVDRIRVAMAGIRLNEKNMVIDYEDGLAVLKHRESWEAEIKSARGTLTVLAEGGDAEAAALAGDAVKQIDAYAASTMKVLEQIQNGAYDTARAADTMLAKAKTHADKAATHINAIDTLIAARAEQARTDFDASMSRTLWLFVAVLATVVVVVVPLTLLNSASIIGPMHHARDIALAIAQGDLTREIRADGRDESAELLGALAHMQQSLSSLVGEVRQTSQSIHVSSSEVASGNSDLSIRTEQAASNLEQTASAMEQLTGTVRQSADSASHASELAGSAQAVAERGGAVVAQVVTTMDEINVASRKIADIIGVIDGIAFQTNILALNAAVEAARAGEQGRGFAVVAGEVRSLAGRSAEAAREIKALIGASVEKVDNGARLVQDAGSTMGEIVSSVQRVSHIIHEISGAAAEQSKGIGQVNAAVVQLDQMTQQNAALVEQSAAAAESLKDQASRLNTVVARFQTGSIAAAGIAAPVLDPAATPARAATGSSASTAVAKLTPATPRPAPAAEATATRPAARVSPARAPAPPAPAIHRPAATVTASATDDSDWESF